MVKNYLLDTNILLQNPEAIYGFEDNNIIICGTTLQELDSKKTLPGELGYNARQTCRILDGLRVQGNLKEGVTLSNGGSLIVEPDGIKQEYLPNGFSINSPDNRIISTCIHLTNQYKENENVSPIILVTNDISMRINATICGVAVQEYKNDRVTDDNYTGHVTIPAGNDQIAELYANGKIEYKGFDYGPEELFENEFVTLIGNNSSALSVYRNGYLKSITKTRLFGGITPMNEMQTYAAWALMQPADELPLVILKGPAGSAKTFLSLSAGLTNTYTSQKTNDGMYRKMLISRPNTEAGDPGFGYLPGNLEDKMHQLLLPYHDNLEALFMGNEKDAEPADIKLQIEDLFAAGIIECCALSYIRGRSLQDSYIICDEAQNATRMLIRDVITRCGKGSKIVIAGDPEQCDNARLDKRTNGLVYAAECFKGSQRAAIITFENNHSVRSELAKEAIERMKI